MQSLYRDTDVVLHGVDNHLKTRQQGIILLEMRMTSVMIKRGIVTIPNTMPQQLSRRLILI